MGERSKKDRKHHKKDRRDRSKERKHHKKDRRDRSRDKDRKKDKRDRSRDRDRHGKKDRHHHRSKDKEDIDAAPVAAVMDRGVGSSALKSHVQNCEQMEIRQTRRGWLQEILGCDAKTEFKYFIGEDQIASSLEDTDCFCRMFCNHIHPFKMVVKELNTESEMVSVDRPLVLCATGSCKCCCYQEASFTSGGQKIGMIKEQFYCCVPRFTIYDPEDKPMYKVHAPTCLGGLCINCCAEGNPCGKGCCKVSFRIYDPDQKDTEGDAEYLGKILKKPKSAMVEIFTDADVFIVDFPKEATVDQKGALIGTSIFLNAIFFEGQQD